MQQMILRETSTDTLVNVPASMSLEHTVRHVSQAYCQTCKSNTKDNISLLALIKFRITTFYHSQPATPTIPAFSLVDTGGGTGMFLMCPESSLSLFSWYLIS